MDFINNNFETTTYYTPSTTPQYSPAPIVVSVPSLDQNLPLKAKKEQAFTNGIGVTDIVAIHRTTNTDQDQADFLVYGNKQNGLTNDIAAILAKIAAEQTLGFNTKTQTFIKEVDPKNHFIETVEFEIGLY
ncbi:MAG: hypothetical protein JNL70_13260 [Saprospiraceae bacterium]|nr:hypothetical protein [Saprospiraceae bacterium]